jgi:DNA-binding transcriptional regulator GbsR (MarR family)
MNSQCDNCKLTFEVKLQEKNHGKGIRESFFTCTHCQTKFFAFITDDYIRQHQNKLKKIYKKGTVNHIDDFNREIDDIKKKIETRMTELRGKYSDSPPTPETTN